MTAPSAPAVLVTAVTARALEATVRDAAGTWAVRLLPHWGWECTCPATGSACLHVAMVRRWAERLPEKMKGAWA